MCGPNASYESDNDGDSVSFEEAPQVEASQPADETPAEPASPSRIFQFTGGRTVAIVPGNDGGTVILVKGSGKHSLSTMYHSATDLIESGKYTEITPATAPAGSLASRLTAAESDTGFKLGQPAVVYGEDQGVNRVVGFARINRVDFGSGHVTPDSDPDRLVILQDSNGTLRVDYPYNLGTFNATA
jgi:hypothetical protein